MESTIVAEEKSTHQCPIFKFEFSKVVKHENADKLGVYRIPDSDYSYVLNLEDWKDYNGLVCWVPPDSLVDTTKEQFQFLITETKYAADSSKGNEYARVKAKKIRQIVSYGLLVKVDKELEDGGDYLGIVHYEPPIVNDKNGLTGGEDATPPSGTYPKYDVDAFLKYGKRMFVEGEPVIISEKIHGANSRYLYKDGSYHCGSRTLWKKEFSSAPKLTLEELTVKMGDEAKAKEVYERAVVNFKPKQNMWWTALNNTPTLKTFLEQNPGYAVYGEVYGQVQKGFSYGVNGGVAFAAFDILKPDGKWMDTDEFFEICDKNSIPHVPIVASVSFDFDTVAKLCEGNSLVPGANHIREGVVICPIKERWDERLGRVKLKVINPSYLEK